jgi:hypothetical protein
MYEVSKSKMFSCFLIYSERGEPGIGGQKGDQGKKHTIHFV